MRAGDRVLNYIVERELGEGGMGSVYLARHTVLNQQVAIKALSPLLSRDPAIRERFIQEANIQAALRHPGIVLVLNAGLEGEQPVLVMEYIEGNSLFEVLERRGALPLDDALKIMKQVLSAVGYAHRQGVIHRDLKPENIMVTAVGDVKVTDFGIAKVLGSARLTRTGTVMGSAYYMSPEQIMNPENVDTQSDIYSLGCVFYELLAGRPPFGEKHASGTDNDFRIKSAHVNEAVPALPTAVPNWLTQLVMSMLEKSTENRPISCEEMLEQIRVGGKLQKKTYDNGIAQSITAATHEASNIPQITVAPSIEKDPTADTNIITVPPFKQVSKITNRSVKILVSIAILLGTISSILIVVSKKELFFPEQADTYSARCKDLIHQWSPLQGSVNDNCTGRKNSRIGEDAPTCANLMRKMDEIVVGISACGKDDSTQKRLQIKSGREIYQNSCAACHDVGVAGAPKITDYFFWSTRLAQGYNKLISRAIYGVDAMPAKGGSAELSDVEVARAVFYMTSASEAPN